MIKLEKRLDIDQAFNSRCMELIWLWNDFEFDERMMEYF